MNLDDFPIARRWPPRNADTIQLYSLPTPNGIKVAVMLEECGLAYDAHRVAFDRNDQFTPEFLSLNPNNKIPAIIDPNGPDGQPMGLWESGAILIYLADKTGRFLPRSGAARYRALQWLMFQMGGVGPMFGQVGFFVKAAGKQIEDPRPRQRYLDEAIRLLRVLDNALEGRDWICDEYSIADMAIGPWLRTLDVHYGALDQLGWSELRNAPSYLARFLDRPAVQTGITVCATDWGES